MTYRGSCRTSSDYPEAWCKVELACENKYTHDTGFTWDWCVYKWDPSKPAHRPSELTVHTTKEQLVKTPTTLLFDILVVYVEKEAREREREREREIERERGGDREIETQRQRQR